MNSWGIVLFVGLIGAGKSTWLGEFAKKGIPSVLADDLFKSVVYHESNRSRLAKVFEEDVLDASGFPLFTRLRGLLFSLDSQGRDGCKKRQDALLYEFSEDFFNALHQEVIKSQSLSNSRFVIVEHSLALRDGWVKKLNPAHVVSLHCSRDVRLKRIIARRGDISVATYEAIMDMQPSDEEHHAMSAMGGVINHDSNCSLIEVREAVSQLLEFSF